MEIIIDLLSSFNGTSDFFSNNINIDNMNQEQQQQLLLQQPTLGALAGAQYCNNNNVISFNETIDTIQEFSQTTKTLIPIAQNAQDAIYCPTVNTLYRSLSHDLLCSDIPTTFGFIFGCFIFYILFGMVLFTFRGALFPCVDEEENQDKEIETLNVDMGKGGLRKGNNLSTSSRKALLEDCNINADADDNVLDDTENTSNEEEDNINNTRKEDEECGIQKKFPTSLKQQQQEKKEDVVIVTTTPTSTRNAANMGTDIEMMPMIDHHPSHYYDDVDNMMSDYDDIDDGITDLAIASKRDKKDVVNGGTHIIEHDYKNNAILVPLNEDICSGHAHGHSHSSGNGRLNSKKRLSAETGYDDKKKSSSLIFVDKL